jgi:streptogramin lyase
MNKTDCHLVSALFLACMFGYTHPSPAAAVNFGSVSAGQHKTAKVKIAIPVTAKWQSVMVRTGGVENLDFTGVGKVRCSNRPTRNGDRFCSVKVTFKPLYAGPRYGAVTLFNNGRAIATTYIYGTGLKAEVAPLPGQRTTITGILRPNGLAVDAQRSLYVVDSTSGEVYKETLLPAGGYSRSAIAKVPPHVRAVAVDGNGNVFVNDSGMYIIMNTLQQDGSYTQRRIGHGVAAIGGMAVDGSGNVYATDYNNGRVFKESPSSNGDYTQTLLLSGLTSNTGISVDQDGNLYIAAADRVIKETLSASTYSETSITGAFQAAQGIALDGNGNLYISDFSTGSVYKESVSSGGYVESLLATDVGGCYVAVDELGDFYVSDLSRGVINHFPAAPDRGDLFKQK